MLTMTNWKLKLKKYHLQQYQQYKILRGKSDTRCPSCMHWKIPNGAERNFKSPCSGIGRRSIVQMSVLKLFRRSTQPRSKFQQDFWRNGQAGLPFTWKGNAPWKEQTQRTKTPWSQDVSQRQRMVFFKLENHVAFHFQEWCFILCGYFMGQPFLISWMHYLLALS